MKNLKKILSVIIPALILCNRCYAVESIGIELTDGAKYLGIGIAVLVIFLIIYVGYKTDKRSEEKIAGNDMNALENEYPYEEESVTGGYQLDEEPIKTSELVENEEYEEESLFNTANNYVQENEEDDFSFESKENVEVNETINTNEEVEDDFSFETKEEINKDQEEEEDLSFETTGESPIEEDTFEVAPIFNTEPEEDSFEEAIEKETTVDKKRFTRKKITNKEEEIINVQNTFELPKDSLLAEDEEEFSTFENEEDFEDEEDDDDDVPTFDELLKKSEEEIEEKSDDFDFMAQMEENLKKNKETRLQNKKTNGKAQNSKKNIKKIDEEE